MIKNILPITELKLKILTELFIRKNLNLKAINQHTNIESPNIIRVLKELSSVVKCEKIGGIKLYSLDENIISVLEPIIEKYRLEKNFGIKSEIFTLLKSNINISQMYVFGSYAKSTQTEGSDIDLIIISEGNKKEIKEKINTFNKKFQINIEPVIFSLNEYENLKKDINSNFNSILFKFKNERIKVY